MNTKNRYLDEVILLLFKAMELLRKKRNAVSGCTTSWELRVRSHNLWQKMHGLRRLH